MLTQLDYGRFCFGSSVAIQVRIEAITLTPDNDITSEKNSADQPTSNTVTVPTTSTDSLATNDIPSVRFNRDYGGQYSNPAEGGDWLLISADENVEGSELNGWSVKSAISGKQFILKDLSGFKIGPSEWSVFVHTAKDPNYTDRAMEGEIHMYFDEQAMAWGTEHDTIQLLNSNGIVVDTITY